MTREILKSFGALAFYLALIVGVIYVASIFAREMGFKRVMIPQAFNDFLWYKARVGGFNLVDYARTIAFLFLAWFPAVIYWNILSASSLFYPPSTIALRADVALTKLVNEKGTRVDEDDIICRQIAPDCISIRHSARATVDWEFYKNNEGPIETSVGVDFIKFVFMQNSEVRAFFQRGSTYKIADILIERPDGKGYQVIKGNGGKYVYAFGDNTDPVKCSEFKIGFVEKFESIEANRMKEAARWDSPFKFVLVAIPVNGQRDETAIHHKLDDYRKYGADEPGREVFINAPPVLEMVQGWIEEMQKNRQMG